MTNITETFTFDGHKLYGGKIGWTEDTDTFVIDGFTTPPSDPPRGTFFTNIPISGRKYRKDHNEKFNCKIEIIDNDLIITDDWKTKHKFVGLRTTTMQQILHNEKM